MTRRSAASSTPAEGGFLPQHGADRDPHHDLVGDLASGQARDPLVPQDRARRRHDGDGQPPAGRGGGEPGAEPQARPQLRAPEAHVGGGQAARGGRRQRGTGGARVEHRVPPAMPRPHAGDVVVRGEDGTRRDRESDVTPPAGSRARRRPL
jgi:hypothetical protein